MQKKFNQQDVIHKIDDAITVTGIVDSICKGSKFKVRLYDQQGISIVINAKLSGKVSRNNIRITVEDEVVCKLKDTHIPSDVNHTVFTIIKRNNKKKL